MTEKNGPHITVMPSPRTGSGTSTSAISVSSCFSGIVGRPDAPRTPLSRAYVQLKTCPADTPSGPSGVAQASAIDPGGRRASARTSQPRWTSTSASRNDRAIRAGELDGVEGVLLDGEDLLDEAGVEQPPDAVRRPRDRRAHPLEDVPELPRGDLGEGPRHGVVLLEAAVDAVGELRHEPREIDARAVRRQRAARVVIAVVHPRLVVVRRPPQEAVARLQQDDPPAACGRSPQR
jgi:hypothetical protein